MVRRSASTVSSPMTMTSTLKSWSAQVAAGRSPREVLQKAIVDLTEIDRRYDPECPSSKSL